MAKSTKKKKTITGLICLGLAALVIAAGFGSGWKYDVKNAGKWFNSWGQGSHASLPDAGENTGVSVAYADHARTARADETEYVSYRQLVNTVETEYGSGDNSLSISESHITQNDYFEYILSFVPTTRDEYWESWEGPVSFGAGFHDNFSDSHVSFASCNPSIDADVYKRLTFGSYDAGDYFTVYGSDVKAGNLYDWLYLTITNERAFCTYFGMYDSASNSGEYADSLNNVLFSFEAGSNEYKYLYSAFFTLPSRMSFYLQENITLTETLNLYKEMEAPVKEGYTFTGWYYDEACTQPYRGEPISADTNLYAGFEINKYTVTYDGSALEQGVNDVGFYDRVITVEHGGIADYVPDPVEGKAFNGWYYEDGTKYENEPITQDVTLIGRWGTAVHTVTFNLNGGEYKNDSASVTVSVSHGSTVELFSPIRNGSVFVGWSCDPSIDILFDGDTPIEADTTLYAIWERLYCTVTFYVDNVVFAKVQVQAGKSLSLVALERGIAVNKIVRFCNDNTDTPPVKFSDFEVFDDVSVYMENVGSDNNFGDDNNLGNDKDENNAGNTIKQFFVENWVAVAISAGVLVAAIVLVVIIMKRKRRGGED